jgi:hypothetical protein
MRGDGVWWSVACGGDGFWSERVAVERKKKNGIEEEEERVTRFSFLLSFFLFLIMCWWSSPIGASMDQ